MGKKGKDQKFARKRKRDPSDDSTAAFVESKKSPDTKTKAAAAAPATKAVWKRVKVKNIQLQETGFFGLEELHIEGDPKNIDWTAVLNAPTSGSELSDAERAKFQKNTSASNEESNDDEETTPDAPQEAEMSDAEEAEEAAEEAQDDAVAAEHEENVDAMEQDDVDEVEDENDNDATESQQDPDELTPEEASDVVAWKDCFEKMHPSILRGLRDVGFTEPTAIQTAVMKPALVSRKDVMGAAETGSGKTLAFMIPILQQIMELSEKFRLKKNSALPKDTLALILTPTRELAMQIVEHTRAVCHRTPIRVVPLIGGIAVPKQERLLSRGAHILVATTGRLWEFLTEAHQVSIDFRHLRFLVLDEADKMIESGRFRELSLILRTVYTAKKIDLGLLSETEGFAQPLPEETKALLADDEEEEQRKDHLPPKPLQTFIFSATLALSEEARRNLRKINSAKKDAMKKKGQKKNRKQINEDPDGPAPSKGDFSSDSTGILDKLMQRIQFQREIELVDLTTSKIVAANIEEAKIHCLPEEKDIYMYYFLQKYKGRTLVFVNSIANIKRIVPLLHMLKVPAWPMHAAMQQRQRLKNLDRFKRTEFCVLVATDVMARGLDIPKIDHVVHYQIPPTAELYVHRSGRTARAQASGLSLCIIDPADKKNWNTITFALKKENVKEFPVDLAFYGGVKKRVYTARELDRLLHHQQKQAQSRNWLQKTAKELGLDAADADEDIVDDAAIKQAAVDRKRLQNEIGRLKAELEYVLDRPLVPEGTSSKYYTKTTFLALKDARSYNAQTDLKAKGKVSKEDRKRQRQRQAEADAEAKTQIPQAASQDSDAADE